MTEGLQEAAAEWHRRRYPDADMKGQITKTVEELGELARAVNALEHPELTVPGSAIQAEAADVLLCMYVLIGRWFPGFDLTDEARKKLAILNDPNSGHRSALRHIQDSIVPKRALYDGQMIHGEGD
jgi:NTP pyrophosphatase (non-canonical NTP hydrolase)